MARRTYGTAKLIGRDWHLELEPHVALRFKRCFPRCDGRASATLRIGNTLEVCRDLKWFCERFPLKVRPRKRMLDGAKRHIERTEEVRAVINLELDTRAFDLALPPRPYQSVAAETLLRRGSLLLADELGVGKTVAAICVLVAAETRPALVVVPTHLQIQWQREMARFAPQLKTHIIKTTKPYPLWNEGAQQSLLPAGPDVLISTYAKLHGWAETLGGLIQTVIFDEVQELRRPGTQKYIAASFISHQAKYSLGLTATPIYNLGDEFYFVLSALDADALGSHREFVTEWAHAQGRRGHAITSPRAFGVYLREEGLMLRRTRQDVNLQIPSCNHVIHEVEADPAVLNKIMTSAAELARTILKAQGPSFDKLQASQQFDMLMRQQTGIAKAPMVAALVEMLLESGEKVVVWGWHRAVYELWQEQLANYDPAMYTGSENVSKKRASFERFCGNHATLPETNLLISSLRSGTGLDGLQKVCRTGVIGELDWSPGVIDQCVARLWRPLQEHPVVIYTPLADTGSDPIVADVAGVKRGQLEQVRDPDAELVERLTIDPNHIKRLAASYLEQVSK